MKPCKHCAVNKELSGFHKHPRMNDGHINVCKDCRSNYYSGWRSANREELKQSKSEYYESVKFEVNAEKRVERRTNPSKYKEQNLQYCYGISLQEYERMHAAQNGKCAICNQPEVTKTKDGKVRALAVDHCHETGEVRALLCGKCNKGIGLLKDDFEVILSAAKYIHAHKGIV